MKLEKEFINDCIINETSIETLNDSKKSKKNKKMKNTESMDVVANSEQSIGKKRKCEVLPSPVKRGKNKNIEMDNGDEMDIEVEISSKKKKSKKSKKEIKNNGQEDIEEKEQFEEIAQVEEIPNKKEKKNKKHVKQESEAMDMQTNDDNQIKKPDTSEKKNGDLAHLDNQGKGNDIEKENAVKKNIKKNKSKGNKNQKVKEKAANKLQALNNKKSVNKTVKKNGIEIRIKKEKHRITFYISFKEDEYMRKYSNFFVTPKQFEELEREKKSLEDKGLTEEEVSDQMKSKAKICYLQMQMDIYGELIHDLDEKDEKLTLKKMLDIMQKKVNNIMEERNFNKNADEDEILTSTFEENTLMTLFEDVWILKKDLPRVHYLSERYKTKIIEGRKDGNTDSNLNAEEEITFQNLLRRLKKEKSLRLRRFLKAEMNIRSKDVMSKTDGKKQKDSKKANESATSKPTTIGHGDGSDASCYNCNEVGHISRNCPQKSQGGASCYNCNEIGHISRDCPKKFNRGGSGVSCYNCNDVGHISRDCPKKSNQGGYGSSCYNCNEVGHISRDCPQKYNSGGSGVRCYNCNGDGHISRDCPKYNQGESGNRCYNCNELGHISIDCPKKSNQAVCYNCIEVGHTSRDCPQKSNQGICFNCNEAGHLSRDCPEKSNRNENRRNSEGFSRSDQSGGGRSSFGGNSMTAEKPKIIKFED